MPGSSGSIVFTLAAINGFNQPVNVSFTGLPSSIAVSPSSFSVLPGAQQTVVFSPSAAAAIGNTSVTAQATAGLLSHTITVVVTVMTQLPPTMTAHAPIRTRYLRTNSAYDPNSLEFAPPHFAAYDPAHRQFFVSNALLNEIDVFDATTESQIAAIAVPLAWGLDVAPTGDTLYVATLFGDIYTINTSTNSIIQRYPSASIGPQGYAPTEVFVLADGRLALLGGAGGLSVDGSASVVVWDPQTNSLDSGTPNPTEPFFPGTVCPNIQNIGAFAVSGDRTHVLAATIDSGGGVLPVCSYDPIAKKAAFSKYVSDTFVRQIIPSPDGSRFFLTSNLDGVLVFNVATVALIGQIPGPASDVSGVPGLPNAAGGAVMSLDGKTLYLVDQSFGSVAAFDTTSLTLRNWIPAFKISDTQDFLVIAAVDETGLILGPMGHGVGFIDAAVTTAATLAGPLAVTPSTGPESGGTQLQIANLYVTPANDPGTPLLYVGASAASNVEVSPSPNSNSATNQITATTPASVFPGPVDISAIFNNNAVAIAPEAFSYGPTILEVVPNAATAEGGTTGAVVGYGFGQNTTGLQVSVGGKNAPVTQLYPAAPYSPYPFPVETLLFTIPPGTAGSSVDLTVFTPTGITTSSGVFHYAAPVTNFPISANLQAGFYDAKRDLYFFSDTSKIQVLSRKSGWQTPISLPGTTSTSTLLAITESPDNSLLAVSDLHGQAIYVLNPDSPSSAQRFAVPSFANFTPIGPAGLAVTNTGKIYFDAVDLGGTGTPAFYKLDTLAGTFTSLGTLQSGGALDAASRVLLSSDGTRVYSEVEGEAFWLDTATDTVHSSISTASNSGGYSDLALSADGSTLVTNDDLTDSSLNAISVPAYIDWETWLPSPTYGQKLYSDGSVLVQPLTDGIDLISRNTGRLLYRVQLPITVAQVYDPVVPATNVGVYGIITAAGVSFVDLSALPISPSVRNPFSQGISQHTDPSHPNSMPLSYPHPHLLMRYDLSNPKALGAPHF
ncbi:IPT/TIG domain-containing protein [Tunturibacter empetritectus]|uniref:IPT/TIG domain-containing protein n=1 Tax=Tunturiibacter empetritectus TaxID=3069691 RepID=A0AAU7Z989_9BACT